MWRRGSEFGRGIEATGVGMETIGRVLDELYGRAHDAGRRHYNISKGLELFPYSCIGQRRKRCSRNSIYKFR